MRVLLKVLLLGCLLLTLAAAAAAQSVCDGLIGSAHGLCTAYCEAMDCASASPQASQTACNKVKANFVKITGQDLPCDNVCPCVAGVPGFAELLNGQSGSLVSCQLQSGGPGTSGTLVLSTANASIEAGVFQGGAGCGVSGGAGLSNIPVAQANACTNLIQQAAAAAGLTCM